MVLDRVLAWYAHVPEGLPTGEARIFFAAKIGYSAWIVVQGVTAFIFLQLGQNVLAAFAALGSLLTFVCFFCLVSGRAGTGFHLVNGQNIVGVILITLYVGLKPGFFLFALVGMLYCPLSEWVSRRMQWVLMGVNAAVFVAALVIGLTLPPIAPLPPAWNLIFAVVNGTATAGLLLMVVLTYRHAVDRAEAALAAEYRKSEALLHNIMPPSVAERLKRETRVIADSHGNATILFADIVGFSELAGRSSPEALVTMLNSIFCRFDDLVDARGLEKIKTIGDAYMVVAGLPVEREDHADAIARLALDMLITADEVSRETGKDLNIRIGIHSGPVVAGVIGQKKFAYDLWGDTVNIAARMESHGQAGRIQVSADTAKLLRDRFVLEPRGTIEIKGKGEMATYFLTGERAPLIDAAG
ncbi:adenylate/guanylate cyclase domain-containing protein [Hoeflea prorocentri]|uniref:Adenylate cyclase n=1 Tax=Hoeflea prorocentri TaxID=1922333 RepID=A0A9X3UL47_9HYPH|nr:adenylate/guanylate cyclase domain-containing protein [Hoeflea prorocentri]MCY6382567.1 adenylate/guanylate cyclase domain-containing protein [Hoeflea prorocentri]MDA5400367.1 adenylate/guanylate cyclase domain-containing protein [Hoeflea prorocentri]